MNQDLVVEEKGFLEWLSLIENVATVLDPKESVEIYWKNRTRPDGRMFAETRRTSIQQGVVVDHCNRRRRRRQFLNKNKNKDKTSNSNSNTKSDDNFNGVIGSSLIRMKAKTDQDDKKSGNNSKEEKQPKQENVESTDVAVNAREEQWSATSPTIVLATVSLEVGRITTTSASTNNITGPAGARNSNDPISTGVGGDVVVTVAGAEGVTTNKSTFSNGQQQQYQTPQQHWSILQSYLQRTLDEVIDVESLVIGPSTLVSGRDATTPSSSGKPMFSMAYRLLVSVYVINDGGGLADVCVLASTAALLDAQEFPLPRLTYHHSNSTLYWSQEDNDDFENSNNSNKNNIIDGMDVQDESSKEQHYLKMKSVPIPLTMGLWVNKNDGDDETHKSGGKRKGKVERHWIVDPDSQEERVVSSLLTLTVDLNEPQQLLSMQLQPQHQVATGAAAAAITIQPHELALAAQMTAGRATELQSLLRPDVPHEM